MTIERSVCLLAIGVVAAIVAEPQGFERLLEWKSKQRPPIQRQVFGVWAPYKPPVVSYPTRIEETEP